MVERGGGGRAVVEKKKIPTSCKNFPFHHPLEAWWKFPKIQPICPDINSIFWPNMFRLNLAFGKFSNFVQMTHQASKKKLFYLFYHVLCVKKNHSESPPILSASAATSTFLANCYNSFNCHQYILKFSLQLIEDLEVFVIEGEHLAILAECGCYSQSDGRRPRAYVPMCSAAFQWWTVWKLQWYPYL